jgi:iron complex transport system substrate-binding protein
MPNRIVSFLPSATEILYELGVGDQIVGVTHECNYPEQAKTKPRVIHSSFDPNTMTSQEIDNKVVDLMHSGKDIYILDEDILKKANPNLIISQDICEVCSPYTKEVNRAVAILDNKPEVLILDPRNLDDILTNILEIAKKVGKENESQSFIDSLKKRITYIQTKPKKSKLKVLCVEWLDPLFTAGHWVPQLVEMAGGINGISSTGDQSRRMEVDETIKFDPDIIILMPCGFDIKRTILEYEKLANNIRWKSLEAVQNNQVYAVNANEYFSKPGPRTVTGLEILAKIIHPELFPDLKIPDGSFQKINTKN